jgi:hypothetical protein
VPAPVQRLNANLDSTNDPCLASLESANRIGNTRIVPPRGERIGIARATTEDSDMICSPRDVSDSAGRSAIRRRLHRSPARLSG